MSTVLIHALQRGAAAWPRQPGEIPLILIEVQTGSYFGADGIDRIEDADNVIALV